MKFNSEEFNKFRESIKNAVKDVEKEFGVEIQFGKISYDETQFDIKTTVFNGSVEDGKKTEYLKLCGLYNLEKEDFGKWFSYKNKKTKIIGLETSRRKYPILVEDEDGKTFLMTINSKHRKRLTLAMGIGAIFDLF